MIEQPRRAAVLGSPIGHSLSPVLHRAAYSSLGLDWRYDALDVREDELAEFVDALDDAWVGLSLTMPLKTAILPLLHDASDTVETVGAANTVLLRDGRRHGHNTDVMGMVRAIRELAEEAAGGQLAGPSPAFPRATILGGGATARSALAALHRLGAEVVYAALRDPGKGADLLRISGDLGMDLRIVSWDEAHHHLDADVVISTVPGGAADRYAQDVPDDPGILLDVAYGEQAGTLVPAWRARGAVAADGLLLLLWQAVDQVALMTGRDAPVDEMRAALMGAVGRG